MDEDVFKDTLKKIRWSTNRNDLAAATRDTLQLLLRRPSDRNLLAELLARVDSITSQLSHDSDPENQAPAVRQAAIRCVLLLQSAKKDRLSRSQMQDKEKHLKRRHRQVTIVLALAVCTAALYMVMLMPKQGYGGGAAVAQQMEKAMKETKLGLQRRDNITVRATHDHTMVSADRLTPEECLEAAQKLQKLGDLSINDAPVGKVTDAKLTQMCHQMHDASLSVTNTQYRDR